MLAVDLPGHGASDPPRPGGAGSALAGTVTQLSAALAPSLATVAGHSRYHPGCRRQQRASRHRTRRKPGAATPGVVLLDPPAWSAADTDAWLAHGLPAITPVWSGGHLLEAWHLVRDSRLFSPWFRREPAGIRPGEPDLDDARIHQEVRDLLRANGAWQALLRDALGYRGPAGQRAGLRDHRAQSCPGELGRDPEPGSRREPCRKLTH